MIESLARLGYASKAVVYAVVGGLATAAAMTRGGRVTDTSGALRVILTQPYGHALLIVLAIGLFGPQPERFARSRFVSTHFQIASGHQKLSHEPKLAR